MKNVVMILTACAFLTGCGWIDREVAKATGKASKTCMDGVLYYQFTSGAAVAYNKDGSIKVCN